MAQSIPDSYLDELMSCGVAIPKKQKLHNGEIDTVVPLTSLYFQTRIFHCTGNQEGDLCIILSSCK